MSRAVLFAILAGVSAATWTICLKLVSTKITPALGALVITTGALVINSLVILATRANGQEIVFTRQALWLMALAGGAAAGVDIFGLLAYDRGLKVTSSFFMGAPPPFSSCSPASWCSRSRSPGFACSRSA